jgi:serine/threonine protein kinase
MIKKILAAKYAEDVFGTVLSLSGLTKRYHKISKEVHPDHNSDSKAADAFAKLTEFFEFAKKCFEDGTYGQKLSIKPAKGVVVNIGKSNFVLQGKWEGEVADVFDVGNQVVKIPRNCADNDLMTAEAEAYKAIWEFAKKDHEKIYRAHLSELVLSAKIKYKGQRVVNVFDKFTDCVTLADVLKAYPDGLDLRHAAWMWRRMLAALTLIHAAGWVHGSVIPANFLIFPKDHRGVFVGLTSAVKIGETIKVANEFAPPEILNKKPAKPETDIYMAGQCMIRMLGSTKVNAKVNGLIRAATLPGTRLNSALDIHDEFANILFDIYGKPKFIDFTMP